MSILSDLGLIKQARRVITARSIQLLSYVKEPINMSLDTKELYRLKKKIIVKNAIEAGILNADKIREIFQKNHP